ncbi:MAG: hypothetical protein COA50_13025 [Flavobacteriaceae bacterium]|nr:MAG: hypothetical protein COA50_13025 [Flavobacteriaceae bacterium]
MSLRKNVYTNSFRFNCDNTRDIKGLAVFEQVLEREYFCTANVSSYPSTDNTLNLVIELDFKFEFIEVINTMSMFKFENEKTDIKKRINLSAFKKALIALKEKNKHTIDVEELNLYTNECSYIIHKIYPHSIPEQIESILEKIISQHASFPLLFKELPYEVFIPVFDENQLEEVKKGLVEKEDYFKFWGLYFQSENDATIYDLAEKKVIKNDLLLLSH